MARAGRVEGDPPVGVTDEFSSDRARPDVVSAWAGATPISFLLRRTGRVRLLDGSPTLGRSIAPRTPYVDSLSELQVRLRRRLRAVPGHDPDRERLLRLVGLTINRVAAGLQDTG